MINQNKRKNKLIKAFTAVLTLLMVLIMLDRKDTMPMDLTQFQWNNRLLLLFAPAGNDTDFKKIQSDIQVQKAEVEDRDLVVFEILERGPSIMNATPLNRKTVDSIRKRFAVPQSTFRVILIGKDGGKKLERDGRTELEDIFKLIDSMPMRQNEMRQKNRRF